MPITREERGQEGADVAAQHLEIVEEEMVAPRNTPTAAVGTKVDQKATDSRLR